MKLVYEYLSQESQSSPQIPGENYRNGHRGS